VCTVDRKSGVYTVCRWTVGFVQRELRQTCKANAISGQSGLTRVVGQGSPSHQPAQQTVDRFEILMFRENSRLSSQGRKPELHTSS